MRFLFALADLAALARSRTLSLLRLIEGIESRWTGMEILPRDHLRSLAQTPAPKCASLPLSACLPPSVTSFLRCNPWRVRSTRS